MVETRGGDVLLRESLFEPAPAEVDVATPPAPDAPAARRRRRRPRRQPFDARTAGQAVLAAAVVALAAVAAVARPVTPGEERLVAAVFTALRTPGAELLPVAPFEVAARLQLTVYAELTGAFDRWNAVVTGAREVAVLACAALVAALVVGARRWHVRPPAVAVAFGLLIVSRPVLAALVSAGAESFGILWTSIGVLLLVPRSRVLRVLGTLVVFAGVVSLPALAAPAMLAAAAALLPVRAGRWIALGGTVIGLGTGCVELLTSPAATAGTAGLRLALLVGLTVVVLAALSGGRRRIMLATAGVMLLVAAPSWLGGATFGPALVAGALVLAVALADELVGVLERITPRGAAGVGVSTVAVLVAATAAAGTLVSPGPAASAAAEHRTLAAWISAATESTTTITAPVGVRLDLIRDGVPVSQLVPDGTLQVHVDGSPEATELFRSGDLGVTGPGTDDPTPRRRPGAQLALNPRLDASPAVRETIRAGKVDVRALVLLAGLAARGPVTVTDLPLIPGETDALPRHRVLLGRLDDRTLSWLRAQRRPYAPTVETTDRDTTLSWAIPAPPEVLG